MWNCPDENTRNVVRASVFLVKSLSCLRFGPSKYQIGADAAAQSASLAPNLFHDAYLQAFLLARIRRRGDNYGVPDKVELKLWSKAVQLAEENYSTNCGNNSLVQLSVILVYYAEAIIQVKDEEILSEKQADRVKSLFKDNFNDDLIECNYRIVMKCAKVYRILKREEKWVEMLNLLGRLKDRTKNAQILYELSMKANVDQNYEEYESLLCRAQEVADAPGHVWVDYSLLRFRSSRNCNQRLTSEKTILAYDDLIAKYKDDQLSRAMLTYNKGAFYVTMRDNQTAIIWMTKAVELLPSVKNIIKLKQRETMLKNMKLWNFRDEWLAWYMDNMMDKPDSEEVQTLYQKALAFNPENEFALHHYGLNRLRAGDLQEAERLFRNLDDTYDSKKRLLAQVLLRQVNTDKVNDSSITKLEECLTLKCKDACHIAANLLRKMQNSSSTVLIQRITDRLISNASLPNAETLLTLYDTRSYELCARMNHVLDSTNAFFVDKELQETAELAVKIQESVQLTLQIKASNADGARRGNAMREYRLKASKLFLNDPHFQTAQLNDAIVSALTKVKSSFDTLLTDKEFLRRSPPDFYPHGFTFAIKEIEKNKDYQKAKSKLRGTSDKKQFEMNELIKWFSLPERTIATLEEEMKNKLPKSFEISLTNTTGETLLKDLLALREAKVFCSEGPWLVLLHYMVNEEKHRRPIDIAQLNEQLDGVKEMNGNFKLPVNAYQLMHRAVEYVEETLIIFEAADCHYKDREHSKTTEVRSEE